MRPAVEAAYAFLKTQYGMAVNKVRGLRNVAVYALYSVLCHVLTREQGRRTSGGRTRRSHRRSSTRDGGRFQAAVCIA